MVNVDRLGMAVYNANLKFRGSARYGDILDIRTTVKPDGAFKLMMHQEAWIENQKAPCVIADIEVVCIDLDSGMLKKMDEVTALYETLDTTLARGGLASTAAP